MSIHGIYERLKAAGLVRSQMQFSEVWLGRSSRYYSYLRAAGREPGLATLIALHMRLSRIAEIDNSGNSVLAELAKAIKCQIEVRAITDVRRRAVISGASF